MDNKNYKISIDFFTIFNDFIKIQYEFRNRKQVLKNYFISIFDLFSYVIFEKTLYIFFDSKN